MPQPSSVVKSFIADGSDLVVEFSSGRCYRYAGAANEVLFLEDDAAESKGAYLNTQIKPKYAATEF